MDVSTNVISILFIITCLYLGGSPHRLVGFANDKRLMTSEGRERETSDSKNAKEV